MKIFAWQGIETEVSLRYETRTDRGIIFFENPSLASRIAGPDKGPMRRDEVARSLGGTTALFVPGRTALF